MYGPPYNPGQFAPEQTQRRKKVLLFGNTVLKSLLREIGRGVFGATNGLLGD